MTASGLQNRAMRVSIALRAARAAACVACWLPVAAGAITFGFFYATTPTRWFNVRATELIAWRNTLILQYQFANATTGKATPLLSGSVSFMLIWQWCGTLAVALGSAGMLWLSVVPPSTASRTPRGPEQKGTGARGLLKSVGSGAKKVAIRCRRLLGWRVPPRGLWRWLMGPGGLTLLDLLLIFLWFGFHIMWMREMTMRTLDNRRAAPPPPKVSSKAPPPASIKSGPILSSNASAAASRSSPSPSPSAARSLLRRLLQTSSSPSPASSSPSSSPKPASSPGLAKAPPPAAVKKVKPLKDVVEESVAKNFGWVGRLDILLLFFPLPRCNFLHWLLGSDFPALIKYHRWLGHGTLVIYSLHGIMYMVIWTQDGLLKTMLNWGMDAGVNRAAGLVSLCGGWLLWLTALPVVRRRLFNLFYGCHILGAVVFMLFSFMHRKDVVTWVMPGILLYLLDVVLRTIQQNFNCVRLSAVADDDSSCAATASVSPEGRVLSLSIRCHQSIAWMGGDTVFLNVPAVSWWQWHPFTITSAPSTCPDSGERRLELRIKSYGRWTKALISRLSDSNAPPVNLYVSGPYNNGSYKWIQEYDTYVFVAGGIGVTPAIGMIQQLIAFRNARSGGGTGRVVLIWVSRSLDELQALPFEILREASVSSSRSSAGPWLQLRLFLTDVGATKAAQPPSPSTSSNDDVPACPSTASRSSHTGADSDTNTAACTLGTEYTASAAPAGTTAAIVAASASAATASATAVTGEVSSKRDPGALEGCTTTCGRPLSHPYMFSPGLWMVAVVLCFGGAFAGLICAQAYDAHMSRTVAARKDFSYVGMLQFAALGLGAVLPPAMVLLAVHLYRRLRPSSSASSCSMNPYSSSLATSAVLGSSRGMDLTNLSAADGDSPRTTAAAVAPSMDNGDTETLWNQDSKIRGTVTPFKKPPSVTAAIPPALQSYITHGRPNLPALLKQLALSGDLSLTCDSEVPADAVEPAAEMRQVGVFAAGPAPLVGSVADLCASLNCVWGRRDRAFLNFTELSFEL